jgi:hypothetical protein
VFGEGRENKKNKYKLESGYISREKRRIFVPENGAKLEMRTESWWCSAF